jgi:DNA polymerase beta
VSPKASFAACLSSVLITYSLSSLVPQRSRAAGLLQLTGDDGLLRDLKISAEKLGRHLDEFGVWKWIRRTLTPLTSATEAPPLEVAAAASHTTASSADAIPPTPPPPTFSGGSGYWSLVKTETEEDIFAELEHAFVEPKMRNFDFVATGKPKAKKTTIFSNHLR